MKICPKCHAMISDDTQKCPSCHTKIINEQIEQLDETTPVEEKEEKKKNNSSKQTRDNNKDLNKEKNNQKQSAKEQVVVKPIELNVKKTTKSPKTKKENLDFISKKDLPLTKEEVKEEKTTTNLLSIIAVLLLIVTIIVIAIMMIIKSNNQKEAQEKKNDEIYVTTSKDFFTSWRTTNNSLFNFSNDLNFYWFEDADDKTNNYYAGPYTYKNGLQAIEEMGYTEEEFQKTFNSEISIDNVYSIMLTPEIAFIDGTDQTNKKLSETTTWWILLIIKDENIAIAYNKTLDKHYDLKREE